MCGIVGYSGKRSAQEVLLNGLEKLEYRGYDSAGVALALEGGIHVVKSKGRLEVLRRKLEAENLPESFCGIGHTRWATHGEPSDVNSHPHSTPRVSIVHNGIIENYGPLKADLMAKGVTFESETDTEVLVKLIDYFCCAQPKQSPLAALREALAMVRGSYALGVLFREEPDTIYAVKKESPLIVGWGEGENFVASDMLAGMQPGDKAALLMVHFGTTYDDTRTKTIDAINAKAKEAFPQMEMREAYTSRIVMRRLKARGIEKPNPLEALLKLLGDGYTHVIVQSTNIIEGVEMESLRRDVASVARFFKEIRVGNPLLYSVEDAEAVVDILGAGKPEKGSVVLVGHGTYTPSTATYAMIDYMLKAKGLKNFHVGTIEGYPTFDTMLQQLKDNKTKQVTLVPFMFVAGDHANNDIAVDWKEALEKEGLKVDVRMQGLGEIPAIQQLFIDHAQFMLKHKMVDIMKKKAKYAKDKDK